MQSYLFTGGTHDGQSCPVADDGDFVQWPVGVMDKELYNRSTLAVGDAVVTIYIHENLTQQQALNVVVGYYKGWAIHHPGGRR